MGVKLGAALREVVLTFAAVVGAVALAAAIAALVCGVRPLIFVSNSMSPGIPTGSLALARLTPAGEIQAGDVVSVWSGSGSRVTHRVVEAQRVAGGMVDLTLKGDANDQADQELYRVAAADKVFWSAPGLGRVVVAMQHPAVTFGCGLGVGIWVTWWFRGRGPRRQAHGCTGVRTEPAPTDNKELVDFSNVASLGG